MYYKEGFFNKDIADYDPSLSSIINKELFRQQNQIELIASENIVSRSVLQAQGSVLTNKYAEGLPGKRYYGGCEFVDEVEQLAINRAQKLFNAKFVNVQPHSGAQANQAVFLSLLKPGDTILGMSLAAGGHLTHGAKPNLSGKWFNAIQYGVRKDNSLIDFDEIEKLTLEHKPKLIIAGGSAYSRIIDFKKFREIADKVNAFFLVDMAHFSGLVAGGVHPNPIDYADIVTTTTHKTLRSGRGGMILTNNENFFKKINSAVFPGLQGGPLMHVIAGKAAGFGEALTDEFKVYAKNIVSNAQTLSNTLLNRGFEIISGGTDNHIVLLSLKSKNITGANAEIALENAGLTCNKNGIPFDPLPPTITSGIRFGSAAATTRGFGSQEFALIGNFIADVLDSFDNGQSNEECEKTVFEDVKKLCSKFPIY
ncbi:serine hydroxymethyltransferase [Alphaproteobacteria bacterium]|jgi:glycine hydroxymethyltransferase|nr:serine hydroxymethyltransferase [Alphaproteobacteria bacterium]MDC0969371.1 serine hydroxymethyltransferase [Alphaproteobacteria bacterium]